MEFDWKSLKFSNVSTFWLFLCKTALFSSFLPVNRTINLFVFFSNFQGFTLVNWQKVGRIWLPFAIIYWKCIKMPNAKLCADKISSFFLSLYPNDMAPKHLFSKFFLLFFLLFGEKSRYLWHLLRYLRNSYRFGIRFQNGFVWAPQNDRSLNISYPDIFTHSIFKRNFWFCKIHLKIKHLHFLLSTQLVWFTFFTLLLYIDMINQITVPDQWPVTGLWSRGHLWRNWRIPNWYQMSLSYSHDPI